MRHAGDERPPSRQNRAPSARGHLDLVPPPIPGASCLLPCVPCCLSSCLGFCARLFLSAPFSIPCLLNCFLRLHYSRFFTSALHLEPLFVQQESFVRDLFYAANTFHQRPAEKRPKLPLSEEKTLNEEARVKIIGLTLETRPDCIDASELRRMRSYG